MNRHERQHESQKRLANKTAVVTGGCSGIGLATVETFAAEGARILIGDVQDEKGDALQKRFGDQVVYRHCDVNSETDIRSLMDQAGASFGGLDIVFNNAGAGGSPARIDEIDGAQWDFVHSLLLRSVALGIRYAVPHLKARGGGSIINTASIAAITAGAAPVAYSTAKAGVLHLTKIAAAQLARFNIRVNAICPGFMKTNIFSNSLAPLGYSQAQVDAALDEIAPTLQPLAKIGVPEYIANVCVYFASDESAFTTGSHLVVDGGATVGPKRSWDPQEPTIGMRLQQLILQAEAKNKK
jgi:NAD(P)-dependent dehydrogenase (short-subunit alcohol dehydrogenase family)